MTAEDPRAVPGYDLEELYAVVGGLLHRTLPDLLDIGQEKAEEAVWDAFIGLVTSKPPFRAADWITAGAIGKACDERRQDGGPLVAPPDPPASPLEPIVRAMALLSEREHEAVRLALRGTPPEDIAEALQITPAYARKLVVRTMAKLRRYLGK